MLFNILIDKNTSYIEFRDGVMDSAIKRRLAECLCGCLSEMTARL